MTDHPNDRITLIGHSQGGVLAAYVASGGVDSPDVLSSEELGKINAVITLDSPLQGVNSAGANVYDTVWDCSRFNSYADSAGDMSHGSEIIRDLVSPRYKPPLFTVDGFEGTVEGTGGLVTIADPKTSSLWWQRSSLRVAAPDHGDVWKGTVGFRKELEDYIYCAIPWSAAFGGMRGMGNTGCLFCPPIGFGNNSRTHSPPGSGPSERELRGLRRNRFLL